MPNQDNPFSVDPSSGPFAEYLQFLKPQSLGNAQDIPGASLIGKTGKSAFFLDKFIEGAQQGVYKKQQLQLAKQRQSDQTVNQYLQLLNDKDPVQAQQLRTQIITEQGKQAISFLNGQDKKDGNPALKAMKAIGEGLLGGPVKKWEGYGDKMGDWAQRILTMPTKEQAQDRDTNAFNDLAATKAAQIKGGDPNKTVYLDDLAQDSQIRTAASKFASLYGTNPMADWKDIYPKDPTRGMTPSQKKEEAFRASVVPDVTKPSAAPSGTPSKPQLFATEIQQPSGAASAAGTPPGGPSAAELQETTKRQYLRQFGWQDPQRVDVYNAQTKQNSQAWMDPTTRQLRDLSTNKVLGPEWGHITQPKPDQTFKWKNFVDRDGKQQGAWTDESGRAYEKVGDGQYKDKGPGWIEAPYKSPKDESRESRSEAREAKIDQRETANHVFNIQERYTAAQVSAQARYTSKMNQIDSMTTQRQGNDPNKYQYAQADIDARRANAKKELNEELKQNYDLYNNVYSVAAHDYKGQLPPLPPPPGVNASAPPPTPSAPAAAPKTATPPKASAPPVVVGSSGV